MVKVRINGREVAVAEGATILEAARQANVIVPTLCFLKDLNEVAACRVCVVEVKGAERLVAACNTPVTEGMEVETNSERVQQARRRNVQLMLSAHDCSCLTCSRNGTCQLQALAKTMNLFEEQPYPVRHAKGCWDPSLPLVRNDARCISCLRCINVCERKAGLKVWDLVGLGGRARVGVRGGGDFAASGCTLCGECVAWCPVSALGVRDDTSRFRRALNDSAKTVVAFVEPTAAADARARVTAFLRRIGVRRFAETLPAGSREPDAVYVHALAPLSAKRGFDQQAQGDLALTADEIERLEKLYGASEPSCVGGDLAH